MQASPDNHFRFAVLSSNAAHVKPPLFWGQDIRQGQPFALGGRPRRRGPDVLAVFVRAAAEGSGGLRRLR